MTRSERQTSADSAAVGSGEQSNSDALPGMIDPVTIQRAYAANVDALKAMEGVLSTMAGEVGSEGHAPPARSHQRLDELTGALGHELRLIDDLRQALMRQRMAVAAGDPGAIESSVQAIGRTLLTLDEARRRRGALIALIVGNATVALADLEIHLGFSAPGDLVTAREAVRRAAEATSRGLAINQTILRHAAEAGDSFLQELFSTAWAIQPRLENGAR